MEKIKVSNCCGAEVENENGGVATCPECKEGCGVEEVVETTMSEVVDYLNNKEVENE